MLPSQDQEVDAGLAARDCQEGLKLLSDSRALGHGRTDVGRAKRSSMPRNSSPFGYSPRCRGTSPFWCGRCGSICLDLGSKWSTGGRRTVCGFLRASGQSSRCSLGPSSSPIGTFRLRSRIRGLNICMWRPGEGGGAGNLASISGMEGWQFRSRTFRRASR